MKIGVIYCAYNMEEYISESISSWLELRRERDIVIAAVCVPFLEYKNFNIQEDSTVSILKQKNIDYVITEPKWVKEHEIRNIALQKLKEHDCDIYILWDADEIATKEELEKILDYSEKSESIWLAIPYKNYVFNKKTYIKEPFYGTKIYKKENSQFLLNSVFWDTEVTYLNKVTNRALSFKAINGDYIPKEIAWIKHYTWLDNEKSRRKVDYQLAHFNGICSYTYKNGPLEFDMSYYDRFGYRRPETQTENES